ncbi:DUF1295 domain-containing protein [Rhodococcus opacus]|uniref:Hypothetical membrane protein n=1 Tax=Rhodococcus opacus (strain B4) TaxID=632772 RepID=C1B2B1_RHOOB|nr:DUF1295 domain-containing protein [Rhodococcus opacus]BAH50535.1 hypothetical membrane protein [Rhodococcus opacus B4]
MNGFGWSDFGAVTGASLLVLAVLQAATLLVGRRIGRYNVVDVTWGLGFVLVALVAAVVGDGDALRRWLALVLVAVWGLRLTWHMYVKSAGKGEDPRYEEMLDRAGGDSPGVVVRKIFLTQGLAQWFVSLPLQVSAVVGPASGFAMVVAVLGVVLWVVGVVFESVGDHQLKKFKADPANKGEIMDVGLWAWTRHPNYFGDACVWWGLWLIAASVWPGAVTVLSPVVMTYFLVFATGARLLEKSMSQRPGYPEYQQRTSYFLPLPPKR